MSRTSLFSSEADMIILYGIAVYGWGNWSEIRQLLNTYAPLQFDYSIRLKSDLDLQKRAEVLMKAVKKEREELQMKEKMEQKSLMKEKQEIMESIKRLERDEQQLKDQIQLKQNEIERLTNQSKPMEVEEDEEECTALTLASFHLSDEDLLKIIPLCEIFRGGVIANQAELEKYCKQRVNMPKRQIDHLLVLLVEKEKGIRSKYNLSKRYNNTTENCIDFSCEIPISEKVREACLEASKETEKKGGLKVTDIKGILNQQDRELFDQVMTLFKGKQSIAGKELFSTEVLKQLGISKVELNSIVAKFLVRADIVRV